MVICTRFSIQIWDLQWSNLTLLGDQFLYQAAIWAIKVEVFLGNQVKHQSKDILNSKISSFTWVSVVSCAAKTGLFKASKLTARKPNQITKWRTGGKRVGRTTRWIFDIASSRTSKSKWEHNVNKFSCLFFQNFLTIELLGKSRLKERSQNCPRRTTGGRVYI